MEKEMKEPAKQSVFITPNLEVIVETNNGVLKDKTEHVAITGNFVIDANSVARLVAALEGKTMSNVFGRAGFYITETTEVIKELQYCAKQLEYDYDALAAKLSNELCKIREDSEKRVKAIQDIFKKCDAERLDRKGECEALRAAIEEFNNTRRPWERKLKINLK